MEIRQIFIKNNSNERLAFTVSLPYPGSFISRNHSHFANGHLKPETRAWFQEVTVIIRGAGNRVRFPWGPMRLRLSGQFRSGRSFPDWDNIVKPLKDCLAKAAGLGDDRDIVVEQGDWGVVEGCEPELTLEVSTWRT